MATRKKRQSKIKNQNLLRKLARKHQTQLQLQLNLRSPPSLPLVSLGSGQSPGCAAAIAVLVAGDPAGQPSQQRFQKNSGEATARR